MMKEQEKRMVSFRLLKHEEKASTKLTQKHDVPYLTLTTF
jgi:hypothetical protein